MLSRFTTSSSRAARPQSLPSCSKKQSKCQCSSPRQNANAHLLAKMPMSTSSPNYQCQSLHSPKCTTHEPLTPSPSRCPRAGFIQNCPTLGILRPLYLLGFDSHSAFSTRASSSFCLQPRLLCSTAPWRDTSSGGPHHLDGHSCGGPLATPSGGESVLFIGTRFSNLYTAVDTPAESACYV